VDAAGDGDEVNLISDIHIITSCIFYFICASRKINYTLLLDHII
jgi:hypothetical protein